MDRFKMRLPEQPSDMCMTEWDGAEIRVTINIPQLQNSMSTMMVIDSRQLDLLEALDVPEAVRKARDQFERQLRYSEWQTQYQSAQRVLENISNQVANHICHGIKKMMQERYGRNQGQW